MGCSGSDASKSNVGIGKMGSKQFVSSEALGTCTPTTVTIVDVTVCMDGSFVPAETFKASHIPGARFLDLTKCRDT